MVKLYLHVGTHKTGTTALQTFLAGNRPAMLSRGLMYPDYSPFRVELKDGHHQFAHSLAAAPNAKLSVARIRDLSQSWLRVAQEKQADVLISAEAMYRHQLGSGSFRDRRLSYLERVRDVLSGFEIEVVIVLRRPDDFARSLYQERVRNPAPSCDGSLPPFIEWVYDPDRFHLRYDEAVSIFHQVFPNVRILIYEDLLAAGSIYDGFFAALEKDVAGLRIPGTVRRSLNAPQTVIKNFALDHLVGRTANSRFNDWLTSATVAAELAQAFGGTRFDLWPSHAEREAFLRSRAPDIDAFRSRYMPERERLFPPLQPSDTLPPVPAIPLEMRERVVRHCRSLRHLRYRDAAAKLYRLLRR